MVTELKGGKYKNWGDSGERRVCVYVCMYVYKGLVQTNLPHLSN
jgi:hypothetical protein